ncbi:DUF2786 domain-containing protein [Enterococcus faecalis]|uniref:DUF2786 domain-containing protein n=1 Tax=Enterococcus faecalis TaxID=1351 RepID=UPI00053487D9|nr:DUF2786 domain-containing protein [Enterococcus faecalis]EGO2732226.1 DUF2786 domain-containing protein [Enterococcus faecalis]EHL2477799.1 DUF2786 domain-containing protein [Enterococcus faecalis]EHU5028938.1 DUF2786 domain-containing protein [Enterococcus faecalis]EJZ8644455.1 DUF2786 domain-containing protein [Enterococcus faecalis]EKJ5043757.1 DUF2786 domain-containing protein [Enterococcus faecalis]
MLSKGLLAISKDQKNDEESQSAFILAQKLMIQYNIDKNEVEQLSIDSENDVIGEESVTIYKRLYWWERQLALIISENFRVKNFLNNNYSGRQKKRRIVFYGFGRDLELAKEMYILAYEVILFHSKNFIDNYYLENPEISRSRYMTNSLKASYINGFLEGLEQRFNEQVSALREVYEVLVLVPEEVESSYKDYSENFGKSTFSKPNSNIHEAYWDGYVTGKEIDFTKSTIDG